MPVPDFSPGQVLTASAMDSIGLWLVKSQTIGTGVSSVTVSDAFTSDYDNYLITVSGGVGSQSAEMFLRLGATVSGYHFNFLYTAWNTTVQADGSKTGTRFQYIGGMTTTNILSKIDVMAPNLPKATRIFAGGYGDGTSYVGIASGALFDTTQYTSFDIFPSAGTMTGGTIRVYGYRN